MNICLITLTFATTLVAQLLPKGPPPIAPNAVVANVAGMDLTAQDVRNMFQNAPVEFIRALAGKPDEFLRQIFMMKYLADDADKLKLGEKSPLKEQIEAEREYAVATARVNYEQDSYPISEQEINDFYAANQSRWSAAKIKVIVIGFKPDPIAGTNEDAVKAAAQQAFQAAHELNDRSQAEATKLAADLARQLRSGADFGKLVDQYSDDRESKDVAGDFGMAVKSTSSLPEDLKMAILALKPGEISDPLKQPTGFYVIRLEEKTVQPLGEVIEPITQELRANHRNAWLNEIMVRFKPKLVRPEFFAQPLNQGPANPDAITPK
jgi:peptidyl-prolyl cis-trans isomerase C